MKLNQENGDVRIDSIDSEHLILGQDVNSTWSIPNMQGSHIDGYYLALGQPIYINSFFMGSEYPATDTKIIDNATQMKYYSGKTFNQLEKTADGKFVTWQTVLGSARSNDESVIQSDFFDYIYDIATPTDFRLQFNSWYDYRLNITPERLEDSFMGIEKGLSQFGVEPIDSYVADDGWNDYAKDFWGFNKNFPNGLSESSQVADNLGADFGLWFGPRGGYDYTYSFAKNIQNAGNGHVNTASNDICIIDQVYFEKTSDLLLKYMEDYNVGYWKLDGFAAKPCPETDHGHVTGGNMGMYYMNEVWENYLHLFEQMRDLRESQGKDLFLNLTSYAWPSPWFLQWVNAVYIQNSSDTGFAGSGSDADRMLTYRDGRYFDFVQTRNFQFPLANIYNHDPVYGKEAKTSLGKDPVMDTDEFRKYLYVNAARGTAFWELYYSYEWLDEEKWMVNSEVLNFAKENSKTLKNTKLIGENPTQNNVYGFSAWDDNQGFITLRNPSNTKKNYTVTLDRIIGVPENMQNWGKSVIIPYQTNIDSIIYSYGDSLNIELDPYEVIIYKFSKNDTVAPKLDKVAVIDNQTIRLYFNEAVKGENIIVKKHDVREAKLLADYKTIEVTLNDVMENKEVVEIEAKNVSDLSDNVCEDNVTYTYYDNHLVNKVENINDLKDAHNSNNIRIETDEQLQENVLCIENKAFSLNNADCIVNQEDMSVSFLIKTDVNDTNILSQGDSYNIRLKNGKLLFDCGNQLVTSKTDISDNQWHQISVVKEPNNMLKIYIDGKLNSSSYSKDIKSINAYDIVLGSDNFVGKIAKVEILNKSLSYDEISVLSSNYPIGSSIAKDIDIFALLNDKDRLPENVDVTYDNGYKTSQKATWNVTDQFNTIGKKVIEGVYGNNDKVRANVNVLAQYPVGSFDKAALKNNWSIIREKTDNYIVDNNGLTIYGTAGYIDNNTNSNDNIFVQEMPFNNCVFATKLTSKPYANWQSGGLLAYQDDDNYVRMSRKFVNKNILSFTVEINGAQTHIECDDPLQNDEIYLAIEKIDNLYRAYYSADGHNWHIVTTSSGKKAEMTANLSEPKVGIYATNAGNQQYVATFDKVDYLQYSLALEIEKIEDTKLVIKAGEKLPNYFKTNIVLKDGSKKDVYVDVDTSSIDINNKGIYNIEGTVYGTNEKVNVEIKIEGEINKLALKIAIDLAESAKLDNVIPIVVKEFNLALQNAKDVYESENTLQKDVDEAFERLANIMHKLEFFKGDKTTLKAFIDKVSNLEESKYAQATWISFEDALTNAANVYMDENAMEKEVNEAYNALVKAFLDLRLIPNKDLLKDLINQAEGLNAASYTIASWDAMQSILNDAKAVFENLNATQKEVDNSSEKLTKAIASLETNTSVNNTVDMPVKGDNTKSVKTGDDGLLGVFSGITLLSIVGYTIFKRKKD